LKIRQSDVYTRMCSDYGVIAGRIFTNNGYGIPNAKLSIFIPILPEDEDNPVISSIYPYKNLEQVNDDGYRFNLLPYTPSYSTHTPTGTFPTRLDTLVNQTVVELYDKYYKYTVTTNDSGDYMIFGVPTGTQTLVMNVDLSDIGPFSLTPQDLIRMGVATDAQFDGVNFKSSPNFSTLPQIITINKTIEVVPFWGQPEICRIGITRSDFDLTNEANINIQPTSVFMGSLMSSNEKSGIKANGRVKKETGNLCKMVTGPGEILAITQSIFKDSDGLPILEQTKLPDGGKLIDGDGTWLFDLPMNMDYVSTNEFGEQILSDDPKVGVPTKAKYRFKIKWQQSKNLNEDYKRGYFLVPNIKERGWDDNNPDVDPLSRSLGPIAYYDAQTSYAFSLSWSAYTTGIVSVSNPDILSIINCEDYFYEFDYNKVYTVSQFIDQFKTRRNKERFIGIKRIDDDTCEDTSNRYPVNDGVFHTSLAWRINNMIITIIGTILLQFIVVYSVLAWIINLIQRIIKFILCAMCGIRFGWPFNWSPFAFLCRKIDCDDDNPLMGPLKFPMLNYPDCDVCDCDSPDSEDGSPALPTNSLPNPIPTQQEFAFVSFSEPASNNPNSIYTNVIDGSVSSVFPGLNDNDRTPLLEVLKGNNNYTYFGNLYYTNDLNIGERINSFNTKAKYYEDNVGVNQVSIKYDPSNVNNTQSHYDNVIVVIVNRESSTGYTANTMITFVDTTNSVDPNITGNTANRYGTSGTTGTTVYPQNVTIDYANPNSRINNLSVTYQLPVSAGTSDMVYSYPSDVEYFQVITGMTISDFNSMSNQTSKSGSFASILKGNVYIRKKNIITNDVILSIGNVSDIISDTDNYVIILQRGVDPYSPYYNTDIGLGKIFGFDSHSSLTINGNYRLNIPVKNIDTTAGGAIGNEIMFMHNSSTDNATSNNGQYLFFPSYIFTPGNYLPYYTNSHRYYSRLDDSVAPVSPPPPTVFASTPLYYYVIKTTSFNNTIDMFTKTNNMYYAIPPNGDSDGQIYYLNLSQNQTPLNKTLSPIKSTALQQSVSVNVNGLSEQDVITFETPTSIPNQTLILGGNWVFNFYASSPVSFDVRFDVYKINILNTETLLFNGNYVNVNSGAITNYTTISNCPSNLTILSTDRILVKVHAKNNDVSQNPIIIYSEGSSRYSFCITTFPRNDAKYTQFESLVGGSYKFLNGTEFNFSPIYPSTMNMNMSNNSRIVMRADRLPSTDVFNQNGDNVGLLQMNNNGILYRLSTSLLQNWNSIYSSPAYNQNFDSDFTGDTAGLDTNVLDSFSCTGMKDLSCYKNSGLSFTVDPNCPANDKVVNGCYVFVKKPLTGLWGPNGDIKNYSEYLYRFKFYYALCQGVLSNVFINNWINGNLFAFPFKINTYYNKSNKVRKRKYPDRVVMLHFESNNFYYRSSPYTQSGKFIGSRWWSKTGFGANDRNLKYPTTIMNLGPRDSFLQEITLSSNFLGYNVNKLTPTSYNDVEDLINFFVITRMTQPAFLGLVKKSNSIAGLFSRPGKKVDGDFAQSVAINSQLGVIPLDGEFYTSSNPNPDIICADVGGGNAMMGVYYNSTEDDIQVRDYISPGREIRYNPNTLQFRYDYQPIKSQLVPNYKWNINSGGQTIFGVQSNNWATSITNIEAIKYQSMDRITSNYPRGQINTDYDYRGYIFGQTIPSQTLTSGTLTVGLEYVIDTYVPTDDFTNVGATSNQTGIVFTATTTTPNDWSHGSTLTYRGQYQYLPILTPNPAALGGAPWYFYFGLTKGSTAINRFFEKYIGITLNE